MIRPLISARNSVENTARSRPTATISSEMDAGFTRAVGILSSRLLPKRPGLICFHVQRPPQLKAASSAIIMRARRELRSQRGWEEEADMRRLRRRKQD